MLDSGQDNKREGLCLDERGKPWKGWIGPRTAFALITTDIRCYPPAAYALPPFPHIARHEGPQKVSHIKGCTPPTNIHPAPCNLKTATSNRTPTEGHQISRLLQVQGPPGALLSERRLLLRRPRRLSPGRMVRGSQSYDGGPRARPKVAVRRVSQGSCSVSVHNLLILFHHFWSYSTTHDVLRDVVRLARGRVPSSLSWRLRFEYADLYRPTPRMYGDTSLSLPPCHTDASITLDINAAHYSPPLPIASQTSTAPSGAVLYLQWPTDLRL